VHTIKWTPVLQSRHCAAPVAATVRHPHCSQSLSQSVPIARNPHNGVSGGKDRPLVTGRPSVHSAIQWPRGVKVWSGRRDWNVCNVSSAGHTELRNTLQGLRTVPIGSRAVSNNSVRGQGGGGGWQ